MISFRQEGDFSNLTRFFKNAKEAVHFKELDKYGRAGVDALSSATPIDSGLTSESWYYKIFQKTNSIEIAFYNSNIQEGIPIAILLQYGHGTRGGGFVQGKDYINPAIRPVFEEIANSAWKEVIKS